MEAKAQLLTQPKRLMTDLRRIELIENRHFNRLSEKERLELEKAAQQPGFEAELHETEALLNGLGALALEDFEGQLSNWEKKHQRPTSAKIRQMGAKRPSKGVLPRLLRVAAVILVLLLPIGYFLGGSPFAKEQSNEALFQAYYGEGPSFMDFRVRGEEETGSDIERELKNRKSQGLSFFNAEDYKMAVHQLNIYVENSTSRDYEAIISLATAHLMQGNADKAIPLYQLAIETEEPNALSFKDQAAWYLALAQLRNNELDVAQLQLQSIAQNEYNDYQEQAQQLLEDIQKRQN